MNNAGSAQSIEKRQPRFVKRRKGELLLRTASGSDDACQPEWAWLARQPGQPDQLGYGVIPEAMRTWPATLVLEAAEYTLFDVSAPPGLKESEYPLLLEEQIMGDLSAQSISCIGRQHGRLQLVVCACERLEAWQQQAHQAGIRLDAIVTDFQRLADPDSGVVLWQQQDVLTLIKPPLPDGAGGILGWPDTELPPLPQDWQPETERRADDLRAELVQLADLVSSNEASLVSRKRASHPGVGRTSRYSGLLNTLSSLRKPLAALMLSLSCFGLAAASQNWSTQSSYRAAVTERLGLPEGTSENRIRRELRLRLNQQSEPLLRLSDTSDLYRQLDDWLHQMPGWQLQRLEMQEQTPRIVLSWQGVGKAALPDLSSTSGKWGALASLRWQRQANVGQVLYVLTLPAEGRQP